MGTSTDPLKNLPDVPSDPALRALIVDTLEWISAWRDATHPKIASLAVVAAVYARFCSPTAPTELQSQLAARFTLLFFLIDDADARELPALVGTPETRRAFDVGPLTPALEAWLHDVRTSVVVEPAMLERLGRSHQDYLAARRAEASTSPPSTLEAQWELRRRTIFMDPYLDHWMILRGMRAAPLADGKLAELRRLAIDLVLVSNDLGSIARDRAGGSSPDDLNLVHALALTTGGDVDLAIERTVERHNVWVLALRREATEVASADTREYLDLLIGVTDGNLSSLRALKARYPGVDGVLSRLLSVGPLPAP